MARVFGSEGWPELYRGFYAPREMSRMFGGGPQYALQTEYPPVNVWANQEGAFVMAQMPGVSADSLDITVHQNTVKLHGKRDPEDLGDDGRMIRRERSYGPFTRTLVLPFRIDAEKISANLDRGILSLELPRPEEDKPRHIKIAH